MRRRGLIAAGLFLASLLVRWPFLTMPGFRADQTQFVMWSAQGTAGGLAEPYRVLKSTGRPSCNYPPIYVYVLKGLGYVYNAIAPSGSSLDESVARTVWNGERTDATRLATTLNKLPAALADAVLAALLFGWLIGRLGTGAAALVAGIYAISPAVIFDSSVWGQVDAIPTLLMVASLEAARRGRILWMTVLATLAILTKAQAIVLAPVWAACLWVGVRPAPRRTWQIVGAAALTAGLVLLPFLGVLDAVWKSYADAARYYPYVHLNGFSAWFISSPLDQPHLADRLSDWYRRDNVGGFLGVVPRIWGMMGVCVLWVIVLTRIMRRRCDQASLAWAAKVLPLGFFVMSTQMHERYLMPAIALWAWSASRTWRWLGGWIMVSACAAANMLWAWPGPAEGWWTERCRQFLHGSGMGILCSLLLIGVLVAALFDGAVESAAMSHRDSVEDSAHTSRR